MNSKIKAYITVAIPILASLALVLFLNASILTLEWLEAMLFTIIFSAALLTTKKIDKRGAMLILTAFMIITFSYSFYYAPSAYIAKNQGTVLTQNWFDSLNWIKDNTAECATVATYWDPGHFITGIANRAVVYDGASQGALRHIQTNETTGKDGLEIIDYGGGINQLVLHDDYTITRARMKDIAISMMTENETLAVELLKDYVKPGCNETYFIASSDLISKSQWWTYFATWSPTKTGSCPTLSDPKGDCYFYNIISLSAAPQPTQNAIIYTYSMSENQAFLIYEANETMKPFLQQGGLLLTVEKIFYFTREGAGYTRIYPDSDVKGLLWLSPDKGAVIYIPPELENSLFTRLYLFNGYGLEHFEFINNWGGEVKLFRVKF